MLKTHIGDHLKPSLSTDGLHLLGSILWLDAFSCKSLCFVSSVLSVQKVQAAQIIATEETAKLLGLAGKRLNILTCQYNRPFSVGRLNMELLPSGSVLGGATLYIESEGSTFLYAPDIQNQKSALVRKLQSKKASTLILKTCHPDPHSNFSARRKEKEQLIGDIKNFIASGTYPIIYCSHYVTAQEITALLAQNDIPVAVHPSIYKINKIYEIYGSHLGSYTAYNHRYHLNKVCIFPLISRRSSVPVNSPILRVVDPSKTETTDYFPSFSGRTYHISTTADGLGLQAFIQSVNPQHLYFVGPYAKIYAHELKNMAPCVNFLYPYGQNPLF